ncbi:MAG: hypothetical protein AB1489_37310, partial [Acidobacteriota bacterium]
MFFILVHKSEPSTVSCVLAKFQERRTPTMAEKKKAATKKAAKKPAAKKTAAKKSTAKKASKK